MMRLALLLCGALAIVTAGGVSAQDTPPPPPQAFYGGATIRSQPAPVGTVVEARGANVKVGIIANPITTTVVGAYGGPTLAEVKLGVQGWIEPRTPVYFYLNGALAEVSRDGTTWRDSIPFQSGIVSRVHLRMLWRVYYLPIWFVGNGETEEPENE